MEQKKQSYPEGSHHWKGSATRSGRILSGFVIILVGATLLIRELGIIELPHWVFSWQMIPIIVGIFIGIKTSFRNIGWIFPFFIGLFFLLDDLFPTLAFNTYLWPIIVIAVGLFIMFGPNKRRCGKYAHYSKYPNHSEHSQHFDHSQHSQQPSHQTASEPEASTHQKPPKNEEEYIDSVSVFGGIKKNIISKDFKGGEIVTIFGGGEYNLSHADINGDVTLEVVQLFGGTRLIIPPHWELKSELVAILGSVEDKRPIQRDQQLEPRKRLILQGTSIFGGIDIRSY